MIPVACHQHSVILSPSLPGNTLVINQLLHIERHVQITRIISCAPHLLAGRETSSTCQEICAGKQGTAASPLSHKPCTMLSSARSLGTPHNCQGLWARKGKQTPMRHGSNISSGQASPQPGGKKNMQSAALCNCFLHFCVIR
jgi:hypothetical protein